MGDPRDIDAGMKDTTRMDQDNEKNIATPKAGANREARMRIGAGGEDIDERKRNELVQDELAKAGGDRAADPEQGGDTPERDKRNP